MEGQVKKSIRKSPGEETVGQTETWNVPVGTIMALIIVTKPHIS